MYIYTYIYTYMYINMICIYISSIQLGGIDTFQGQKADKKNC